MKRKLVGHTQYDKNGKLLKIESLDHHSMAVKTLFSKFCHGFGMKIVGDILSYTHDMAKGTEVFEKRVGLRDSGGEEIHFAHNVRGGIFLFEKYGDNPFGHMLAVCDVGHHGQLPNWSQPPSTETSKSMINADRTVLKMFLEYKERERVRKDYALYLGLLHQLVHPEPGYEFLSKEGPRSGAPLPNGSGQMYGSPQRRVRWTFRDGSPE